MAQVIYAIIDPRSAEVFYVGRTAHFERRRSQHVEGTDQLSGLIVGQIRENGFIPQFVILERRETELDAAMAEIFWIELFKARGAELTNAQAFAGHEARGKSRKDQAGRLSRMRSAKSGDIVALSNGTPPRAGKTWSQRELRRLGGMKRKKMSVAAMADALGRKPAEVKKKLEKFEIFD
jgi:hypothetical protein